MMNRNEVLVPVEIEDIKATTDDGLWVVVKSTGKLAWLPRSRTQINGPVAFIPQYLADKICPCDNRRSA